MEDGVVAISDTGTGQGSSPLLSNVYLGRATWRLTKPGRSSASIQIGSGWLIVG